ncbi:MAG TPA: DUF4342 domain-containing protein [Chloroflexota bacterium]|nr:DUF4342 domain-containing protein [Chloroflexota bacterium]
MSEQNPRAERVTEEFKVRGTQLVDKLKDLIAAGNVREVAVKHDGRIVVKFPLTVGVIGTLLAPQLAALGALAALLTDSTIEVVRNQPPSATQPTSATV